MVWNSNMQSAIDIALVKLAVEICNAPEMKRKLLYDIDEESDHKLQLNEIVKQKEEAVKSDIGLPNSLHEKLMSIIFSVGMKILVWAMYHKSTVELSREYIINFLNSSLFTQRGLMDNKRAAKELMKCQALSNTQKYKISCIYCFTDYITVLFSEMSNEDKEMFYDPYGPLRRFYNPQQKIVMFWSYYVMNSVHKLTRGENIDQYRLEVAVNSGSVAAVQYCLEETNLRYVDNALVDAAVKAVRNNALQKKPDCVSYQRLRLKEKCLWVPGDYYKDILYFTFSKMTEDQQRKLFQKDIEIHEDEAGSFEEDRRCRTIEYFLNWPYQDYFMHAARLVWDILSENNYAVLLLKICDKIESDNNYGEQNTYDYIKLLKEFWCQSPERYKTYVLSNQRVIYKTYSVVYANTCIKLLSSLICLKNVDHKYRKVIEAILDSGTSEEIKKIIYSDECIDICMEVIKKENWKMLDERLLNRFFTNTESKKFKRELINIELAKDIFIKFVKNDKWDTAELLLKWSDLPDMEIIKLKCELIKSPEGIRTCKGLIFYEGRIEGANKFCEWALASEENIREFKNALISSELLLSECTVLVSEGKIEGVDMFINWCSSDQANIKDFKKKLVQERGYHICYALVTRKEKKEPCNDQTLIINDKPNKYEHSMWAEFEKFLSWGLSSEIEKNHFKKEIFKNCGEEIYFNLIYANKCEEALNFFNWFDLSEDEIRELKMKTVLSSCGMKRIHNYLLIIIMENEFDCDTDDTWENIKRVLNSCLQNEETVLTFKSNYDEVHGFKSYQRKGEIMPPKEEITVNKLYSLIEDIVHNFRRTSGSTKRKLETLEEDSPRKSCPLHNSKCCCGGTTNRIVLNK